VAYIQLLNREEVAIVDDSDVELLSKHIWSLRDGYAVTTVNGKRIWMHRLLVQCQGAFVPDHKNRNRLDNRRDNLRVATHGQNAANQSIRKDNTSGFKGVSWNKSVGRWKAQIRDSGKKLYLGCFSDAIDAAKAYDAKALAIFGEFAAVNFPREDVS
jgi:hypothetical protein